MKGAPARKLGGAHYLFSATPLPKSERTAFACVISKKIAPRAVDRVRAKRQCRAALRKVLKEQAPLTHAALVLRIKHSALKAPYRELERDISTSLLRLLG